MKTTNRRTLLLCTLALSTACSDAAVNSISAQSASAVSYGQRLEALIAQSRNDLASRLQIDPAKITVVEARQVRWPDSSTGCPEPGFEYMQTLVEGALIRLTALDQTYQYHAGPVGDAVLCEHPSPVDPPSLFEEM
jgi:hypothetical protein